MMLKVTGGSGKAGARTTDPEYFQQTLHLVCQSNNANEHAE